MVVSSTNAWNFAYVLPPADDKQMQCEDCELVIPDILQMGWCESPPLFCTASETGHKIIQELMEHKDKLPLHKFEHEMMPLDLTHLTPKAPLTVLEVFMDDFITTTNKSQ